MDSVTLRESTNGINSFKRVAKEVKLQNANPEALKEILKELVEEWKDMKDEDITVKQLTGGVTNTLYRCRCLKCGKEVDSKGNKPAKYVLLRVYGQGSELLIDREKELRLLASLYKCGVGPKLYGSFVNGFVYGYFPGRPLSPHDLRSCKLNERIAASLGRWHKMELKEECQDRKIEESNNTNVSSSSRATIWTTIDDWLSLIPAYYNTDEKNQKFKQMDMDLIRKEAAILEQELRKLNSPIVFTHNDLLSLNIVYQEKNDLLNFIDYEYANYNYRGFDIANHFCEWTGFELDHSKFPNQDQQLQFFKSYLKAANAGNEPTEEELQKIYEEVNKFVLLSHMFWSIWALVQADISSIQFDYLQYAADRLKRYFELRQQNLLRTH